MKMHFNKLYRVLQLYMCSESIQRGNLLKFMSFGCFWKILCVLAKITKTLRGSINNIDHSGNLDLFLLKFELSCRIFKESRCCFCPLVGIESFKSI